MVGWLGVGWACGCFGGFDIWRCIGACMGGGAAGLAWGPDGAGRGRCVYMCMYV